MNLPTVDPAATDAIAVAGLGVTLQVKSGDVALVTGELLRGSRTGASLEVEPVIRVVQMSETCVSGSL